MESSISTKIPCLDYFDHVDSTLSIQNPHDNVWKFGIFSSEFACFLTELSSILCLPFNYSSLIEQLQAISQYSGSVAADVVGKA